MGGYLERARSGLLCFLLFALFYLFRLGQKFVLTIAKIFAPLAAP